MVDMQQPAGAFVKTTVWKDLPNAAKNILEWIDSPDTGKKNVITIEVGQRPAFSVSRVTVKDNGEPIVVDRPLFETIKFFVENSKLEHEYPFLTKEDVPGRLTIWNDMPEFDMNSAPRM